MNSLSKSEIKKIKKAEAKAYHKEKKKEIKKNLINFVHYENSTVSDYYFDGIFRKVYPYYFTFKAYAKKRWIGRSLIDMLLSDFGFLTYELISSRCENGDILVNQSKVDPNYLIKDSDFISHHTHRHELPVLNKPIDFIANNDNYLVINKPSSIPVHPCGQYTLNSIAYILANEYNLRSLRITHRLDRMTSGLLILSKNYDSSLKLSTEIADRTVSKYYICHTEGYFPNTLINESDLLINFEAEDGVIKCDKPMGPLCARMGIHTIISEAEGGKSAQTHFTRLVYDPKSDTSLVLCRLFTGRTHQIRLHLQYLGFPIVDDPVYNTLDWGKNKGKGAQYELTREEIVNNFDQTRTPSTYEKGGPSSPKHLVVDSDSIPENCFPHPKVVTRLENSKDSECSWCSKEYYDPIMKNLILRLHAYRYCASDWSYTAPLPDWAIFIQSENLDNLIEEAIKKL